MEKIDIIVVDDQNLFRQSLALLVKSIDQFNLIGEFSSAKSLLAKLQELDRTKRIIAIVDLEMPEMSGIELNDLLQQQFPNISVIILSVHINAILIAQLIDAKASAYLAKNCDKSEFITAIQTVYDNGFYFDLGVLKAIQSSANHKAQAQKELNSLPSKLSDREIEILQLICREFSSAEIAAKLFLSIRTIEAHRNNLLAKTGCRNTAGLVSFAIKHHLFSPTL